MSSLEIILDMVVGAENNESSPRQQNFSLPQVSQSNSMDFVDILKMHCNQFEMLRASFGTFNFKNRFFSKFISFKKRKNNEKKEKANIEVSSALARMENVFDVCNKSLMKNNIECPKHNSDSDIGDKQMLGFGKNIAEDFNYRKENESNMETEENNKTSKKHDGLETFLTSVLKSTTEFSDEEILELEIQILKIMKSIKGKRELKKNLRRYCSASLNFKESPFFCNDFKNVINTADNLAKHFYK